MVDVRIGIKRKRRQRGVRRIQEQKTNDSGYLSRGCNLIQDTGAKGAESLCTPIAQEHLAPEWLRGRQTDGSHRHHRIPWTIDDASPLPQPGTRLRGILPQLFNGRMRAFSFPTIPNVQRMHYPF
jgi:hypothetical protein